MTQLPRVLCVCADDFGVSMAVDDGIVDLASRGRLNAVSCLVTGAGWRRGAQRLAASMPLGLHFNLTEGEPASGELRRLWPRLPALPRLMAAAALRRLPLPAIAHEWRAQWARFAEARGRAPDFIDGHQHVHHLPGVREIVLEAAQASAVAVRNTGRVIGPGFAAKRWAIEFSGGRRLQSELRRRGIAHNALLCGAYGFEHADYRGLVQRWLAALPPAGALLFCHPAAPALGVHGDAIAATRQREAAYLGSEAFTEDLAAAGVSLGDAWRRRSSAH